MYGMFKTESESRINGDGDVSTGGESPGTDKCDRHAHSMGYLLDRQAQTGDAYFCFSQASS